MTILRKTLLTTFCSANLDTVGAMCPYGIHTLILSRELAMIPDVDVHVSFSVIDIRTSDGLLLPVICTSDGDAPQLELAMLRFAIARRIAGDSHQQLRSHCYTLCLLRDFYLHHWQGDLGRPSGLASLIASFLRARRTGLNTRTKSDGGDRLLRWNSVRRETVFRDRRTISDYAGFCIDNSDDFAILPLEADAAANCRGALERLFILKRPPNSSSAMLGHLDNYRCPRRVLGISVQDRHTTQLRTSRASFFLPFDEVRRLIDLTRSPMQKMLFIQAFFGGPRLSEMLHQWRCDILPGRSRPQLFSDDVASDLPVVILAHPSISNFTGAVNDRGEDRVKHLRSRYKRLPRNFKPGLPEAAGWKGMAFDNDARNISQVFFANRDYALLFYEIFRELNRSLFANIPPDIANSHPYLFVNDDPSRKEFGLPLKISNARKIFRRAYDRLPAIGPEYRSGSHGARHFYKSVLDQLLPGDANQEHRSKCLHHLSPLSQKEYARSSAYARAQLIAALDDWSSK